jgi:hypothetical protein
MKWISVDDKLPENCSHVLICLLGISVFVGHYNHGKKLWRMGLDIRSKDYVAVTHWMPLPDPPESA